MRIGYLGYGFFNSLIISGTWLGGVKISCYLIPKNATSELVIFEDFANFTNMSREYFVSLRYICKTKYNLRNTNFYNIEFICDIYSRYNRYIKILLIFMKLTYMWRHRINKKISYHIITLWGYSFSKFCNISLKIAMKFCTL